MQQTGPVTGDGGVRAVLRTALPLIASMSGTALMLFCDRMMLSWYSEEAIAASMPAGILAFTCMTFFIGTAGYAQTFVAQYTGAGRESEAGAAVWQGLWLALVGGLILAAIANFADPIFTLIGHAPAVREQESSYFAILTAGGLFTLISRVAATFWTGRGVTSFVMYQGLGAALLNIVFNWFLIFGHGGLPALGIQGAAIGSVAAEAVAAVVTLALLWRRRWRTSHGTWPRVTLRPALLLRLWRFGSPHGLRFFLDLLSFTVFVQVMGRLDAGAGHQGANVQVATNIVFSINAVAFLPMMGIGHAVAILVGQALGAGDPALARRTVHSARSIIIVFAAMLMGVMLVYPQPILQLFARGPNGVGVETLRLARLLLFFVCAWELLDGLWIVAMSALQGAGDTRFSMWAGIAVGWLGLVLPVIVAFNLGANVWQLWVILLAHVGLGAAVFTARYRTGIWERMRVI